MPILSNTHNRHPETILFRQFEGEIQKEDIFESWKQIINNKTLVESPQKLQGRLNEGCDMTDKRSVLSNQRTPLL